MKNYLKFFGMIITSMAVMLFLMYLNTYQIAHVTFSETRMYMAILMGATMAIIMLVFMLHMLTNRRWNMGIVIVSIVMIGISLFLVRSQTTVNDTSYMKAMIPHHSIAILTSKRANISDPRVRELADEIIEAQRQEIDEMKRLIEDLENDE